MRYGEYVMVAKLLNDDPSLLDSYSPEGFTALALAAHFGYIETLEFLISRGGNVRDQREVLKLLTNRGAHN